MIYAISSSPRRTVLSRSCMRGGSRQFRYASSSAADATSLASRAASPVQTPTPPVTLLADDGCYHAELRGVRVEGTARAVEQNPADSLLRLEVAARRTTAWDYSAMRPR